MAGLLNPDRFEDLCQRLRGNTELYGYVLANVDRRDLDEQFLLSVAGGFARRFKTIATGFAQILAAMLVLWFLLVPLFTIRLNHVGHRIAGGAAIWNVLEFITLSLLIVVILPLTIFGLDRFLKLAIEKLRAKSLPEMITVLRYFDAHGAMRYVISELDRYRRDVDGVDDDYRVRFAREAPQEIERVLQSHSYMTEDEMLERLDDPFVAASVPTDSLSADFVDGLIRVARNQSKANAAKSALDRLRRVYAQSPDFQEVLARLFMELASDASNSRGIRQIAVKICREFGIAPIESATRSGQRWQKKTLVMIAVFSSIILAIFAVIINKAM
jgi:hypothetical protein